MLSPTWDEEFAFRVGDLRNQLLVAVIQEDRGQPLSSVAVFQAKLATAIAGAATDLQSTMHSDVHMVCTVA
jgi:hypothetical protein